MANSKPVGVAYSDPQLDGAVIGASGGTVGFFGATPTTQVAALTTINLGTLATAATAYLTTAQIAALQTDVNGLINAMKALGLMANS